MSLLSLYCHCLLIASRVGDHHSSLGHLDLGAQQRGAAQVGGAGAEEEHLHSLSRPGGVQQDMEKGDGNLYGKLWKMMKIYSLIVKNEALNLKSQEMKMWALSRFSL